MNKKDVIARLEECAKLEYDAVPLYAKYLDDRFFLSGFEEKDRMMMKGVLKELRKESESHKKIFEYLLHIVRESGQDVY